MRANMHTTSFDRSARSERGAVLIHVALAMLILFGFTAFVLDYGVFWLGRRQAQNSADAGALAGAIARSFDEAGTPSVGGPTETSATLVAQSSQVVGAAPGVVVSYGCPTFAPEATFGPCVRVDTFRDGTNGSTPLPTYFANIWGLTSQNVRATATAQVRAANYSDCLKPWMIPNLNPTNGLPFTTADIGYPPTGAGEIVLKAGNPGDAVQPSFYFEIGDASTYEEGITGCEISGQIGDPLPVLPGNRQGPTRHGVQDLIAADPMATVDQNGVVTSGCAPNCLGYEGKPFGPRVVAIAMYDPQEYINMGMPSGNFDLHIVNILAFFILSVGSPPDADVTGVIVGDVGLLKSGPMPAPGSGFLHVVQLIR
jgi:Putative Flp pilus-assembly TadE/G-like